MVVRSYGCPRAVRLHVLLPLLLLIHTSGDRAATTVDIILVGSGGSMEEGQMRLEQVLLQTSQRD